MTAAEAVEEEALQAALRAEHAAVWGYGIVGSRIDDGQERRARSLLAAHRRRRDRLVDLVDAAGGQPAAAEPAYALPFAVTDAASAVRLGAHLEEGVAAAYADLVAGTEGDLRALGASALAETAVWAAQWRGTSVAFPGLAERA